MKKLLLIIVLIIAALIIAAYFTMDILIKEAVQKYVPPITKTNIQVSSVHTSVFDGEFKVKGLAVGNPSGFSTPNAFTLGEIEVSVSMKSLFSDVIMIKEITIDKAVATIEISKSGTNLGTINKNINDYMKNHQSADKPAQASDTDSKKAKKVVIKELTIKNSSIQLASSLTQSQKMMEIPLPTIQLKNIGEEKNPMTLDQAFALILSTFSQQSMQTLVQNARNLLPDLQGEISKIQDQINAAKGQIDSFKGEVEAAKKQLNDTKENFKSLADDIKSKFSK